MNMQGAIIAPDAIRFERVLPRPIEDVWSYLVEPEKRALWLAGGPIEARVGGSVELHFRHADLSPVKETVPDRYRAYENGGTVRGQVTRWEPPHALAYTWAEAGGRFSEVTFELSTRGDATHLVLTHRRLEEGPEMLSVASGWHTHLDVLLDRLNGRDPSPFWSTHARVEEEYQRLMAVR